MNHSSRLFVSLVLLMFSICIGAYAQLIVSGPYTITSDTTVSSITVMSGGVLTANGQVTVTGDMTVQSNGIVTHAARSLNGLRLDVGGTLDIQNGGMIDVNAMGLKGGGSSGSAFGDNGETFNANDSIVSGATGGNAYCAGASYGGRGGNGTGGRVTNASYGILEDPRHLGSGGAGVDGWRGGNGGGRVLITTVNLIVNGLISANGDKGVVGPQTAGGSGGAIKIVVTNALSGAGQIQADGGSGIGDPLGEARSGGGGGGRIAIYYGSSSLPITNISAKGTIAPDYLGGDVGSPGTIYLKSNAETSGDLIIEGNYSTPQLTPLKTQIATFRSLTIKSNGRLNPVVGDRSSFSVEQPVQLTAGSELKLGTGVTMMVTNSSGFDVQVQSGSMLNLDSASVLNADRVRVNGTSSTVNSRINLSYPGATDLELSSGGIITMLGGTVLTVGVFNTTNMQGGTVNIPVGNWLNITSNNATIGYGVTLIKDGQFGLPTRARPHTDAISDMVIDSGGVVTHAPRDTAGLQLNITGTLDIRAGGMIDVNSKGLKGGNNQSQYGLRGETFNAIDSIVSGAGATEFEYPSGGSYGGSGGDGLPRANVTNPVYGVLENPRHLGSGGGGTGNNGFGGNGGGRVTITAGTILLAGRIRANGDVIDGVALSSGGSGGAIKITVGSLSGSGWIQALGGTGQSYGCCGEGRSGGGGGGRVAIYYGTLSLLETNIMAYGYPRYDTLSGEIGSPGTIYLKGNAQSIGDVIVDGGLNAAFLGRPSKLTPLKTLLTSFRSVTVRNHGRLYPATSELPSFSVEQPIMLTVGSELKLGTGVTMTVTNGSGFDVQVESGSVLNLDSASVLNADRVRVNGTSSTLNSRINLTYPAATDFELSGGASVNMLGGTTVTVGVFNTTNMQGGTVNIPVGSRLNITSNSAMIGYGVTLVKDGEFGSAAFKRPNADAIGDMVIDSGGVVTHAPRDTAGLQLNVTGTLDIRAGGMIDVNSKGLKGGNNGSIYGDNGETFGANDLIVSGAGGATSNEPSGASYGGLGGDGTGGSVTNPVYGVLENPRHLGSGGGGKGGNPLWHGGNGGGRITIVASTILLNGRIRANGDDGVVGTFTGGGSGGGIKITANSISGSGYILANGGFAYCNTGGDTCTRSGGGGRIALYYVSNSLPIANINAYIGGSANLGSPGTVFLKSNSQLYGDAVIENAGVVTDVRTPLENTTGTFKTVTVGVGTIMQSTSNITVTDQTTVRTLAYLRQSDTLHITNNTPPGLTGGGMVLLGTIRREIAAGQTGVFRFESDSTYIQYSGGGPVVQTVIAMTTYADTHLVNLQGTFIGGSVDTTTHTITVDGQKPRGKWAIGIPRLAPYPKQHQADTSFVKRLYAITVEGDGNSVARLSFRYEASEIPVGAIESQFQIFSVSEPSSKLKVSPSFFLEGPYSTITNQMRNDLKAAGVLAGHFGGAPVVPTYAVDSITISIRLSTADTSQNQKNSQPGWLLIDGTICDFSDTAKTYVEFDTTAGNYFVVIRHRNHLSVMSAASHAMDSLSILTYDFSTSQDKAYGGNAMKQVGTRFCMVAGDANGSTIVTASDANAIFGKLNLPGYHKEDVNLSGIVTAADANTAFGNLNRSSLVPSALSRPMQASDSTKVKLNSSQITRDVKKR